MPAFCKIIDNYVQAGSRFSPKLWACPIIYFGVRCEIVQGLYENKLVSSPDFAKALCQESASRFAVVILLVSPAFAARSPGYLFIWLIDGLF